MPAPPKSTNGRSNLVWLIAIATFSTNPVFGANDSWIGGNGNWMTAANWNNQLPTIGDNVFIDNGGTVEVTSTGPIANNIRIDNGSRLRILADGLVVDKDIDIRGGAVLETSGSAQITVGRHLDFKGSSTWEINLTGDTPPVINIAGDLKLNDNVELYINTDNWTGGATTLTLSADSIKADVAAMYLNGQQTTDYSYTGGQLFIGVPEPKGAMIAVGMIFAASWFRQLRSARCGKSEFF